MPNKDGKGPKERSRRPSKPVGGRGLGNCKKNKGYTNKSKKK